LVNVFINANVGLNLSLMVNCIYASDISKTDILCRFIFQVHNTINTVAPRPTNKLTDK